MIVGSSALLLMVFFSGPAWAASSSLAASLSVWNGVFVSACICFAMLEIVALPVLLACPTDVMSCRFCSGSVLQSFGNASF